MPDMLVKLYTLPEKAGLMNKLTSYGIAIRRPIAPEKHIVVAWVRKRFGSAWASECETAFSHQPVSCYIALKDEKMLGFACYDTTCKDFFGPTGVCDEARGKGVGKALLLQSLYAMAEQGYAYAIIGGAGPVEFYAKTVGAVEIDDSVPGIYKGMLKSADE